MRSLKIEESPAAISICGWALFYGGLFSVVGLFLLVAIADDLIGKGELPSGFASMMRAAFAMAACSSIAVYGWAVRRWFAHFLRNAWRYSLSDVALTGFVGLALGIFVWMATAA